MENRPIVVIWGITGLMGASLGLALKKLDTCTVIGLGRNDIRLQGALRQKAADSVSTNAPEVLAKANYFLMATPVSNLLTEGPELIALTPDSCLSMDLGSVKEVIAQKLGPVARDSGKQFLPCHPMCGSEKTGLENAQDSLYKGARVILCPGPDTPAETLEKGRQFWQSLGSQCLEMTAHSHDQSVAGISHLPHLISSLLVLSGLEENPSGQTLAATGFKDSTRLANADPALWRDIFQHNPVSLLEKLNAFQTQLSKAKSLLESSDFEGIESMLAHAKELRSTVIQDSTEKENSNG